MALEKDTTIEQIREELSGIHKQMYEQESKEKNREFYRKVMASLLLVQNQEDYF